MRTSITAFLPLVALFTRSLAFDCSSDGNQTLAVCCGEFYDYTPPSADKFAIFCTLTPNTTVTGDYACPAPYGSGTKPGCCEYVS